MNPNPRDQKQKLKERAAKLKQLRDDLEDELLKQFETSASETKPSVKAEELAPEGEIDDETCKRVIEALLFASSKPQAIGEIRKVLKGKSASVIERKIRELQADYERDGRSFRIQQIAGGWEVSTERKYAPWILRLEQQKRARQATQSALETLAIIAYKQPLSRAEMEDLRGVDCSAVLSTLLERNLIKIVGKKEIPGRPFVYGTTEKFLEHFGLAGLDQLPNIEEIKHLVEGSIRKDDLFRSEQPVEVSMEGSQEIITAQEAPEGTAQPGDTQAPSASEPVESEDNNIGSETLETGTSNAISANMGEENENR